MCDQLDHSMGSYMSYFQILCILLSAVLIYLLTKIIIEKNETAISMTKILGYENREIASIYLLSTTIVVIVADAICVVLGALVMNAAWKVIMYSYSGWFSFVILPAGYMKMFAFVLIGYLIVMVFDFMRIRKIPMDQALKKCRVTDGILISGISYCSNKSTLSTSNGVDKNSIPLSLQYGTSSSCIFSVNSNFLSISYCVSACSVVSN